MEPYGGDYRKTNVFFLSRLNCDVSHVYDIVSLKDDIFFNKKKDPSLTQFTNANMAANCKLSEEILYR